MSAAPRYHFLCLAMFRLLLSLRMCGLVPGTDVATLRGTMIELADRRGKLRRDDPATMLAARPRAAVG